MNYKTLSEKLFGAVIQSPELPQNVPVACQGTRGAYSQIAANSLFAEAKITYMTSFEGVFKAVDKGLCRYGVLPIENSTAGSVTEVYDLLRIYDFFIVRSVKIPVNHVLLTKGKTKLENIKEIFTHEQAIRQCSVFLKAHPEIKVTACANTAVAARMVSESNKDDTAAISSLDCKDIYQLYLLSSLVQNHASNYTRFICISKSSEIYISADKISLLLTTENRPGALFSVLKRFAELDLNITKLESRPIAGTDFEFMFYFDFEGSVQNDKIMSLLGDISQNHQISFLGNYSELQADK